MASARSAPTALDLDGGSLVHESESASCEAAASWAARPKGHRSGRRCARWSLRQRARELLGDETVEIFDALVDQVAGVAHVNVVVTVAGCAAALTQEGAPTSKRSSRSGVMAGLSA
jgi:hypothetical protein